MALPASCQRTYRACPPSLTLSYRAEPLKHECDPAWGALVKTALRRVRGNRLYRLVHTFGEATPLWGVGYKKGTDCPHRPAWEQRDHKRGLRG
jgi:hypothetical protein